jgi:hypothetical protein
MMHSFPNRRRFLQTSLGVGGLVCWNPRTLLGSRADEKRREKIPVAAIVTEYRKGSHADVIVGKVLEGWEQDGGAGPDLNLASLYVDQRPDNDLSQSLAVKHGFLMAKTIDEALTLETGKLAVGGVLVIAEHGKYAAVPGTQQVMYPKRRFLDEVLKVFRRSNKVVPVFSDKHLSHDWSDAKYIYDQMRELKVPFMAGSSVPVMWRVPEKTIPLGSEITEAIALGYGPLEHYGFHALEGMQCLMERRKGGETGVKSVQSVSGEGIWQAEKDGRWSKALFEATVAHSPTPYAGKVPRPKDMAKDAVFYLIEYRDGTKATVAMGTGYTHEFTCGVTIRDQEQPFVVTYYGQDGPPYGHFAFLLRAIDQMMHSGHPSYPVERTLLTTGVLDAAMHSWAEQSRRMETPYLEIAYTPVEWPFAKGAVPQPRRS